MIRLFVPQPLAAGAILTPSPDQARYLTTVMRRAVGDEIALFNGVDGEWRAVLAEVSKRGCVLRLRDPIRPQKTIPDVDLIVALIKRTRLETIVEKAAELGARRVRLVVTRFANADHARTERLRAIAIEAAEQTGRLDIPEILDPEPLSRMLDAWPADRRLMFCDEAGAARPVSEALAEAAPGRSWAILIGPEGGFSPDERDRLRAADFVTTVTLGPRILRADTAAISALSLWQAALGDWTEPPAS
jgi:16S rRNA (uracil1498-N3)-methyltransferase